MLAVMLPNHLGAKSSQHCIHAVNRTFSGLFGLSPKCLATSESCPSDREISGVIPFVQDEIDGILRINFSKKPLLSLMSHFYKEEITDINNKVIGGLGEITNIVFAMIKQRLNGQGMRIRMGIPEVVIGRDPVLTTSMASENFLIRFDLPMGEFTVEMLVFERKNHPKAA